MYVYEGKLGGWVYVYVGVCMVWSACMWFLCVVYVYVVVCLYGGVCAVYM